MIERFSDKKIIPKFEQTAKTYQAAFAGYPWYENLTSIQTKERIKSDLNRPGFEGVWFVDESDNLIGASWYYDIDLDKVKGERGDELALFTTNLMKNNKISQVVWQSMTLVSPEHQRQGVGSELKKVIFQGLQDRANKVGSILYLTRIREDNSGSQGMNKNFLKQTGIKIAASRTNPNQPEGIMHEYWYRIIKSHSNE